MAKIRFASEKYVDNASEKVKAYADSQRLAYEEERLIISSKEISGNDGDWGFYSFNWDDASIKKNDGDLLTLHITSDTNEEGYAQIPLYHTDATPYGDRMVECLGTEFGYMGIKGDDGYYTGIRIACPEGFFGTLEVHDTVVTQMEDKFIPDTIARTTDTTIEEWEHLGTSESNGDCSYVKFSEPLETGDEYKVIEHQDTGGTNVYEGVFTETIYGETFSLSEEVLEGMVDYTFEVYKKTSVLIKDVIAEIDTALDRVIAKYGLGGDAE